jgi:hypothetical protein
MQTHPQQPVVATPPDPPSQPGGNVLAWGSQHTRTQAIAQGEFFDLDNVSDSDDDDNIDNHQPVLQSGGHPQEVTGDNIINDPTIPALSESKIAVADTHYFFKKPTDKVVCRECR